MFKRVQITVGEPVVIDTLDPPTVRAPYTAVRAPRTIVHQLLQSDATRVTHRPVEPRRGTFTAVFEGEEDATEALDWFATPYLFLLERDNAPAADTLFAVTGGDLEIRQELSGQWELSIPYQEVLL